MSCVEYWFSDDESDSGEDDSGPYRLERRRLRDMSNPLDLPHDSFMEYFRVSKELFRYLLDFVEDKLGGVKSTSVPATLKLSAALRFFAEGSYQKGVGNDMFAGMAQPTLSKILTSVIDVFEAELCPTVIQFPVSDEEKSEIKRGFYERTGFPGVIGCVDGTHVKIFKPMKDIQHLYYNRKGFHSLNVMIVCDHQQIIRYVNANSPGANHDSFIWNNDPLDGVLNQKYLNGERNTWLVGDAGYPLKPYLITPFRTTVNAPNSSRQTKFNDIHSKTRMIVERTFGVMKNVFRCILAARQLHYKPEKAARIVNVCCALHNLRKRFNVPENHIQWEPEDDLLVEADYCEENDMAASEIRQEILYNIT